MMKRTAWLALLIFFSAACFADTTSPTNNNHSNNAPAPVATSAEVTIAPSTMQLDQIKQFFDHGDYQHLQYETLSEQKSLAIPTQTHNTP